MKYVIEGGNKVFGKVEIQSAKNSVLSLISASVLSSEEVFIENCPNIYDVECMLKIIKKLGARVKWADGGIYIDPTKINSTCICDKLSKKIRASLFLVGPLLGKFGAVTINQTGGCDIGSRPLDIHIDALEKLGASVEAYDDCLYFHADKLKGNFVRLKYPSVGATENAMMCATLSCGVSVIENCAKEPEVVDLQRFLNKMGAKIQGAGTSCIRIEGVKCLHGCSFKPIPDRIETGTFMLLVATLGGELEINGIKPENILFLAEKLRNNACKISLYNDIIYIRVNNNLKGLGEIVTAPYPGFPTDLQPLACACALSCDEETVIKETIFENRFKYAEELLKLNANLEISGNTLRARKSELVGSTVYAPDLRGGASLCIAGLYAEGVTVVENAEVVERGYENFDKKLKSIGAKIIKKK
ncbi:MAG: UDP-N-acetylglucosamine 1-carboxyvinyltransferase [Clostridia bacterium]|nr:UDP-N-acetylglucosamine 1-carboxyvinyltransferase [Clostridia bacterium]